MYCTNFHRQTKHWWHLQTWLLARYQPMPNLQVPSCKVFTAEVVFFRKPFCVRDVHLVEFVMEDDWYFSHFQHFRSNSIPLCLSISSPPLDCIFSTLAASSCIYVECLSKRLILANSRLSAKRIFCPASRCRGSSAVRTHYGSCSCFLVFFAFQRLLAILTPLHPFTFRALFTAQFSYFGSAFRIHSNLYSFHPVIQPFMRYAPRSSNIVECTSHELSWSKGISNRQPTRLIHHKRREPARFVTCTRSAKASYFWRHTNATPPLLPLFYLHLLSPTPYIIKIKTVFFPFLGVLFFFSKNKYFTFFPGFPEKF